MIRAARSFFKLPSADQRAVVLLFVLVPLVEALLLTAGFKRTAALIWKSLPASQTAQNDVDRTLARYARLMKKVSRVAPFGRCLAQSLALGRLLQQRGIAVELVFGQSKVNQKLAAHAWLEYQGKPINESTNVAQHYLPFRTPVLKTESECQT